jgi:hypothetical protein
VTGRRDEKPFEPRRSARRAERLAEELGLELPFKGPLDAFALSEEPGPGVPICLGGDLHAVDPEARGPRPPVGRDESLDAATVGLDDEEHESIQALAVEGIWCLALREEMLDSAPYFTLWDTQGRLRTWLLLPPPRLMIGLGRFWLPSVPPPGRGASPRGDSPPGA